MMTETAGRVADGLLLHPFSTDRYLREVTLPALAKGRAADDAPAADPEIVSSAFVATGRTDEELSRAVTAVRRQIAFYGSTPAHRAVLDLYGLGDLGEELTSLSKSDRPEKWSEMGTLVSDDILELFAVVDPRMREPTHPTIFASGAGSTPRRFCQITAATSARARR
jgi:alkanesulfonate monooxygenase SsuD/methylene tetrahydromethanopterin reductase-like flavin-dependent oxidoreductase (luciferase family)